MKISVLDKGFLKLIDHFGNDLSVVKAARVSHGMNLTNPDRDKQLIYHLMQQGHESPFEHVAFTFHVKCPLFVARQWMRHRISSYNELSGRYTELKKEFYVPMFLKDRIKPAKHEGKDVEYLKKEMQEFYLKSYSLYEKLLNGGMPREVARVVLPLATYTQFYWTANLRSIMNFLSLRADSRAQWEMQQYAIAVAKVVREKCPWSYDAFIKYRYKGDALREAIG